MWKPPSESSIPVAVPSLPSGTWSRSAACREARSSSNRWRNEHAGSVLRCRQRVYVRKPPGGRIGARPRGPRAGPGVAHPARGCQQGAHARAERPVVDRVAAVHRHRLHWPHLATGRYVVRCRQGARRRRRLGRGPSTGELLEKCGPWRSLRRPQRISWCWSVSPCHHMRRRGSRIVNPVNAPTSLGGMGWPSIANLGKLAVSFCSLLDVGMPFR